MDISRVKLKTLTMTSSMTTNLTNQTRMPPLKSEMLWRRCAIVERGQYQKVDVPFAKICN
jgi:hypothetical protein